MNKLVKKLMLVAAMLMLAAGPSFAADAIRIGLMCPLTGKWASEGQDMQQIVSLLVSEVNKAGGINGKQIELIVEDDAGDPRTASLAAQKLASAGVKELIIIAQDITRYGTDLYGEHKLAALLRELCKLDFHWIRLHYLYPELIDDELIDEIASEDKIVKYLDIPIQHINDTILRRMNRRGTGEEIRALFKKLRERIPGLVLRTSLITGLPYEDEAAFEELCGFLGEQKLQRVGAFAYSPEEGTPAAKMLNRVDTEEAKRRAELVMEVQSQVMDQFNDSRMGDTVEVLCDGWDGQSMSYVGRSYAESPGIDGNIYFTSDQPVEAGDFVRVRITGAMDGELTGERTEE